jgi:hypothetical protein
MEACNISAGEHIWFVYMGKKFMLGLHSLENIGSFFLSFFSLHPLL